MPSNTASKFIILDRDGTIIEDKDYIFKIEDLRFLPNAINGLQRFRHAGYKFIIVTNQAGIARGVFNRERLNIFNRKLIEDLEIEGINIQKIYYCPHHPNFTGPCHCRKPNTELVKLAEKEFDFDASSAIFIGDKDSDTELGKNCNGFTVLIENNKYPHNITADLKAKNLEHAFQLLKSSGHI